MSSRPTNVTFTQQSTSIPLISFNYFNYLILIIFRSNKYVRTDAKDARIKTRWTSPKASVTVARLAPTG